MSPDGNGQKLCQSCGVLLPATTIYFHTDRHQPDGLRNVCRDCRSQERKVEENLAIARRIKELDEASVKALDALLREDADIPHLAEVYQRLLEAFNGVGGFAQHYMGTYLAAKPGSSVRQKMLDTIVRMSQKVTESGAAQVPVELLSDEDLNQEIEKRAKRLLIPFQPPPADGASDADGTAQAVG